MAMQSLIQDSETKIGESLFKTPQNNEVNMMTLKRTKKTSRSDTLGI